MKLTENHVNVVFRKCGPGDLFIKPHPLEVAPRRIMCCGHPTTNRDVQNHMISRGTDLMMLFGIISYSALINISENT